MGIFDVEDIINGTEEKRIINGYNHMTENYTEESAKEFYEIYSEASINGILENSEKIFTEAYFGTEFIQNILTSNPCFTMLESKIDEAKSFIDRNGEKMGKKQKTCFESYIDNISTFAERSKNTIVMSNYIKENVDETIELQLMESEDVSEIMESATPAVFFTYLPFVADKMDSKKINKITESVFEFCDVPESYDEEQWSRFIEAVITCNKLSHDSAYMEALSTNVTNPDVKIIFEYFMNTNINDTINKLVYESANKGDVCHINPVVAVNSIFFDMEENNIFAKENAEAKKEIDTYKKIAYETTLNILATEYQTSDDIDSTAVGYTLLKESESISDFFQKVNIFKNDLGHEVVLEASDDEDVDDDEIDQLGNTINDEDAGGLQNNPKKPVKPKANMATTIQNKAMDAEVQQRKNMSKMQQAGEQVKGAFKAVAQLPKNVIDSITNIGKSIDKMDDARREKYMKEPGFRKKIFRNLKLVILYGGAGLYNFALIPVVMVCRHFSKLKDGRIRNQLANEIETEIKICEEKINDARDRNDNQAKYALMRIRDKLEAERVRVQYNSKMV